MNNKYDVLVTYAGDGDFKFQVRKIGEIEISSTKPVFIYNADVDTINNLRVLKRLLININIGAKPTGAFRVFNMDDYDIPKNVQIKNHVESNYKEPISNVDITNILKSGSTSGPITDEDDSDVEANKKVVKAASKKATKTTKRK